MISGGFLPISDLLHPFLLDLVVDHVALGQLCRHILLAKKVDAVYSDDPETNPNAIRYESLTHKEVLEQDLKVMDSTAASLCRDNNIAIHVFALAEEGNVMKAVCGEKIGTIVR